MEVHVPASPSAESQEEDDPIIHDDHSGEEEEPQGRHLSNDAPNTTQEEGLEHVAGSEQVAAADVNRNAAPASSVAGATAPAASLLPLVDGGEEEEGGTDSDMDTEDSGGYESECSECGTSSRGYLCCSCGGPRLQVQRVRAGAVRRRRRLRLVWPGHALASRGVRRLRAWSRRRCRVLRVRRVWPMLGSRYPCRTARKAVTTPYMPYLDPMHAGR
ncbi:hypothetical protein ZWY2020_023384 [Hordeum vulgare]|nr:hypothetical protein ZWY2020_023384 [Hordeum vulgare]